MAQYPPAIAAVNSSALQQPITIQSSGSYANIGSPGGPVVYSTYGAFIIPSLAGSAARTGNGQ